MRLKIDFKFFIEVADYIKQNMVVLFVIMIIFVVFEYFDDQSFQKYHFIRQLLMVILVLFDIIGF